MAYRKDPHRIHSGGVAWLPPGDLIPPDTCQDCTNFRPDSAGNLISRQGSTTDGTAGSNPIRSLITALGHQYQGSDAFYRDYVSVDTGYDGVKMGLVDFKNRVHIMNRSRQRVDTGAANRAWGLTAPATKCTAADGTEYNETLTTFDSSETWTVDPTGDDSFDGTEKQEGTHSLLISADEENTYTIYRAVTKDLNTLDSQTGSDKDKFRWWIFASKFKKLDGITIKIDVSSTAGAFQQYYVANLTRKFLKRTVRKGWFQFQIRRAKAVDSQGLPIDDLPYFERVGGDTARSWATVTAVQIILDTRAAVDVRFDLLDIFGSTAAQIEGQDIQYYYTYATDEEQESNPSPVSDAVRIDRTSVAITGLADSADAQVTGKYLYRTGGTLGGVYRVSNTKIAQGVTTYTDTASDDDLTDLGIQLETDNDAPPAARGAVGPYYGRIVAYNSAAHKNRFWWSKINKTYSFPKSTSEITGNWNDIGDTNEEILSATMRPNMVLFYKENSIWRMTGDPDDASGEVHRTNSTIGTIGYGAVINAGSDDYFRSKEGIYRFGGEGDPEKISDAIDPIFRGKTVTLVSGITFPPISAANGGNAVLGLVNTDRLYFSYPEEGQTNPNKTLIYDIRSGRWFPHSLGFTALYYEGTNGSFLGGRSNGAVLNLETGTDDSGAAIAVVFHSRRDDQNLPDLEKTYEDFTIDANTGGVALTVTAYYNDAASSVVLSSITTLNTSSMTRVVMPFTSDRQGIQARNIDIRITGNAGASPIILGDRMLNYQVEARQGKAFDTDELKLGNGKMAKVKECRLDIQNAAAVAWDIYSDQPGFGMAKRSTKTIAIGSTRRIEPVMFPDGDIKGGLHRCIAVSTDCKIYGVQVLYQVYGAYLFGSKGEYYLSDPLDFGTERVKLFKEAEVVYELTGGDATWMLETDLPGNALASRKSGSLTPTSGEQCAKLRLPGIAKGRLCRFGITPTSGAELAIMSIRLFVKSIGAPNASGWDWVPLPLEETVDGIWTSVDLPIDDQQAA